MFFKKIEGLKELGVIPKDIINQTLDLIQEYEWGYNKIRQKIYKQHQDTETILLRFKPPDVLEIESKGNVGDYNYSLYNYGLMKKYGTNIEKYAPYLGQFSDIAFMLVKLKAGGKIPLHTDSGEYFERGRRIHIPLHTNRKVLFQLGERKFHMKKRRMYEIDNTHISHGVHNNSKEDRIHLIVDMF
tara:strand:- start:192 stop:749 length:558 start_codon:yes stop_codon:yes gene_type:complete